MDTKWMDEEYELQYYGFSSTDFIADLKDFILGEIKETLTDVEGKVLPNLPEEAQLECSVQFNNLYEEYTRVALEHINSVEEEIRGYFAIPPHVLLPKDTYNAPCPISDIETLENEIKQLEDEYAKKRAFKFLCEKELETLNKFETLDNRIKTTVTKITHKVKKSEEKSEQVLMKVEEDFLQKLAVFKSRDKFKLK